MFRIQAPTVSVIPIPNVFRLGLKNTIMHWVRQQHNKMNEANLKRQKIKHFFTQTKDPIIKLCSDSGSGLYLHFRRRHSLQYCRCRILAAV